jgi:hypothetical protein
MNLERNYSRKLRSNSRWWQFTDLERAEIREIFEHNGEMAAVEYCRKIGKPWSHTSISRFFAKERAARRAEDIETRQHLLRLKEIIAIYAEAGMDITEAMAFDLAMKLGDALRLSEADPETAEGRTIIWKVARHVIALRALDLREREETDRCGFKSKQLELAGKEATNRLEIKSKEIELALKRMELKERLAAVQEKKLAEAIRQNADQAQKSMPGSGNNDEKTEALERSIFAESWDDDLKDEERSDSPPSPELREGEGLGAFLSPAGERIKVRGRWDAAESSPLQDPDGCILMEGQAPAIKRDPDECRDSLSSVAPPFPPLQPSAAFCNLGPPIGHAEKIPHRRAGNNGNLTTETQRGVAATKTAVDRQ